MGRGLEAILSVSSEREDAGAEELRELPVELISPNPKQPRRRFDQERADGAGRLARRARRAAARARAPEGGRHATS